MRIASVVEGGAGVGELNEQESGVAMVRSQSVVGVVRVVVVVEAVHDAITSDVDTVPGRRYRSLPEVGAAVQARRTAKGG